MSAARNPRLRRDFVGTSRTITATKKALALIGFMGSGKTVVGALVAERANAAFLDLDDMIEKEAGMNIAEIFATEGEAAFRAYEAQLLPQALQPGAVAALGGGATVADSNWRLVRERAVSVYLEASLETLWQRIARAAHRPLATGRERDDMEALLEQRRARYQEADHRVDSDRAAATVAEEVLKLWSG